MQTIQVGEFKARFSEMIDSVRAGETIVVAYGRNQEKVAALIPYDQLPASQPRQPPMNVDFDMAGTLRNALWTVKILARAIRES